jgi:hypothetical protein
VPAKMKVREAVGISDSQVYFLGYLITIQNRAVSNSDQTV